MNASCKKITLGALAAVTALTLALSVATPASAQYYRGGGWGGGAWAGPAVAAGVIGGMALGAAAANAANGPGYYGPGPGPGPACWVERRAVFDEDGNFLGRRNVRLCE